MLGTICMASLCEALMVFASANTFLKSCRCVAASGWRSNQQQAYLVSEVSSYSGRQSCTPSHRKNQLHLHKVTGVTPQAGIGYLVQGKSLLLAVEDCCSAQQSQGHKCRQEEDKWKLKRTCRRTFLVSISLSWYSSHAHRCSRSST